MPAGARQWSGREKGWPARQRNSSLLVSARQLQALVRQPETVSLDIRTKISQEPQGSTFFPDLGRALSTSNESPRNLPSKIMSIFGSSLVNMTRLKRAGPVLTPFNTPH